MIINLPSNIDTADVVSIKDDDNVPSVGVVVVFPNVLTDVLSVVITGAIIHVFTVVIAGISATFSSGVSVTSIVDVSAITISVVAIGVTVVATAVIIGDSPNQNVTPCHDANSQLLS